MTEAGDIETTPEDAQDGAPSEAARKGMSPYATGGGGVTFERKVAVTYLAEYLLVGDGAAELGDERRVVSVAFQQAPAHPVDDLVVSAARADEIEPSLVLALGVRRAPDLVKSDESTREAHPRLRASRHQRAGRTDPSTGLRSLSPGRRSKPSSLRRSQVSPLLRWTRRRSSISCARRTSSPARSRGRLNQIEGVVTHALADLELTDSDTTVVQQRTWEVLSRFTVLMPRLEPPDETDWTIVVNSLIPVARGGDLAGASRLRDRLVALAGMQVCAQRCDRRPHGPAPRCPHRARLVGPAQSKGGRRSRHLLRPSTIVGTRRRHDGRRRAPCTSDRRDVATDGDAGTATTGAGSCRTRRIRRRQERACAPRDNQRGNRRSRR